MSFAYIIEIETQLFARVITCAGISGLTEEPPAWLESFPAFLNELHFNFGPYDETGEAEHELAAIHMKDSARISDYMVKFASLAIQCPWGDSALRYRFYDRLPARIKDELSKLDKPQTLEELQTRCQHIDARYWERQQERAREQRQNLPKVSAPPPTTYFCHYSEIISTSLRFQETKTCQDRRC